MFALTDFSPDGTATVLEHFDSPQEAVVDYITWGWETDSANLLASHLTVSDLDTGRVHYLIAYSPTYEEFPELVTFHPETRLYRQYRRVESTDPDHAYTFKRIA